MPLKDIKEELYNPKSDIEKREHDTSVFDTDEITDREGSGEKFKTEKKGWEKYKGFGIDKTRKRVVVVGGIVLGVVLLFSVTAVVVSMIRKNAFAQDRVTISVEGETAVESGQEISYVINYENDNRTALENVVIVLNHSENFYPQEGGRLERYTDRSSRVNVGDLKPKGKGQVEVTGKFYATEDYIIYLQPEMIYKPGNSSSEFKTQSQLGVKITTSPIKLEIKAPKEALDESTADYEIRFSNIGEVSFDNLNLRLEYSDGFIFQGATPSPVSGDNVWHIGELAPEEEKVVLMQGKINGDQFDVKSIKATIYRNEGEQREVIFGKAEEVTKVVVSPLVVTHQINGQSALSFNLGDSLRYRINYANTGNIGFRDIIIRLKIDSPAIGYKQLILENGAYDSNSKTITWKASDVIQLKNLEPGAQGFIDLEVPIKERIEVASDGDKNFSIESVVTIDSSDVAFHSLGANRNISNKVVARLNSKVILEQNAFYNDKEIDNFGPLPPKVGEETSYAIHWKISNISNDISDTKVVSYLPTWVKWKGKIFPSDSNLKFNERTHEIVWDVGRVGNATGILSEPKEVIFQVSVVPEINQVNKDISIMTNTVLTAKDDFTLNEVEEKISEKSTRILEDTSVESTSYLVVE